MTEEIRDKLIDLFYADIANTPWDVWSDTSSVDKERIVVNALAELGLSEVVDIDEAYDLFWEWAECLDEDSFRQDDEDFDDEE